MQTSLKLSQGLEVLQTSRENPENKRDRNMPDNQGTAELSRHPREGGDPGF
jgi:hypothetical protein